MESIKHQKDLVGNNWLIAEGQNVDVEFIKTKEYVELEVIKKMSVISGKNKQVAECDTETDSKCNKSTLVPVLKDDEGKTSYVPTK